MDQADFNKLIWTGKQILDNITNNSDAFYIIEPHHIGDLIFVGGFAHAVKESRHVEKLAILAPESLKKVKVKFKGVTRIDHIPNEVMHIIDIYINVTKNYETDKYIYGFYRKDINNKITADPNWNILQNYTKNIFGIPQETNFHKPILENLINKSNIEMLLDKYKIDKNRTIVLAPYAQSNPSLNAEFWIKLVMVLNQAQVTGGGVQSIHKHWN